MKRVLQYIFQEVKEGRLSKPNALELAKDIRTQGAPVGHGELHPLLQRNTSDLSGQRFFTHLSEDEPCLRVMNGSRVLPDVAHLEMARAAVKAAAGEDVQAEVYLEQVEWLSPVVVGPEGLDLHVELFAEDDGRTSYEIYSIGEAGERAVHSQGRMVADPVDQALEMPAGTPLAEQPSRAVEVAELPPDEQRESRPGPDPHLLVEKTLHRLKALLVDLTRLKVEQIDAGEPLESYGINSVMIMEFNRRLGKVFDGLSKTLFFEYPTLSAVAEYLAITYGSVCARWTGLGEHQLPTSPARPANRARPPSKAKRRAARRGIGPAGEACDPIAIIGMSGRYPDARNLDEYWENLKSGKDCIGELSAERWPLEGFYNPDVDEAALQGQSYSKAGGFLSGFAEFDPLFFNITPREAADMDPQERIFIEGCWQALEDGGYTREQLRTAYQGRVGVFVGISKTGFALHGPDLWRQGQLVFPHTSFGSVANRVSYLLNLCGPSMPIDTMCSASLTAIHEACEHLYRDECELALAGGVNLYLHPQTYVELCAVRMLSKDGRCKSFGKDGNGYVPGEGVGVVLLKRLSQALEAEDQIHAVIRATSINHGGKTNGYTVPNPVAQKELVRSALAKAQVNARSISYIEAHGTGTELGDPIEISGLTQAFAQDTADKQFCAIGSAKSNIGHLEAAAGIAGVCKVVLQLKHRQLVPSLHAEELNPHIDFANSPFVVQRQLEAWRRPVVEVDGVSRELPLLAGVSSFGAGGSNAHVVIEEYVGPLRGSIAVSRSRPALVVLSAKNADRLREQVEQLVAGIGHRGLGDEDIADLAYTLQVGREAMESRLAVMAGSMAELVSKLGDHLAGKSGIEELYRGEVRREKEALSVLAGEDIAPIVDGWVEKGRHGKLLELWVKGWSFDWQRLYGEAKPRRISLPTYPFARERYWIEPAASAAAASGVAMQLPPLQRDASDASGQRFSAHLSGEEPYLRMVNGAHVLPDVAHLDLAHAAVKAASGEDAGAEVQLEQVEWLRPVVVGAEGLDLHIELFAEEEGRTGYEISSAVAAEQRVIHSQGWMVAEAGGAVVAEEPAGTLLVRRRWEPGVAEAGRVPSYGQHWVVLCAGEESWAGVEAELKSALPQAHCMVVGGGGAAIAQRYEAAVLQVMALLQGILRERPKGEVLIQAVVGAGGEAGLFGGLSGLLRTARLEHPKLKGQVVALDAAQGASQIVAHLQESSRLADEREVRYRGAGRQVWSWEELASRSAAADVPWRDGGVYLITGGAGGLGPAFAEEIARRAKDAVVVLAGRSELDEEKRARLSALEGLGARVAYHRVDVADGAAVKSLIASLRESYGCVSGIIHAAGVIRDSFLVEKTAEESGQVLAPKVAGVVNLDEATAELTLDFMVLFSSGSGSFGNVGQSDYAAANGFLDSYAAHRNELVSRGERFGRTLSIAWPLWRDGGMKVDAAIVRQYREAGMRPLETAGGLQALYQALASEEAGIVVLSGELSRLRGHVEQARTSPPPAAEDPGPGAAGAGVDPDVLSGKTLHRLKGLLAELTRLKVEQIDAGEALESYGIDSVMIMELNHRLGKVFGELSKTLFFEYPTLSAVAEYLATEHGAACARWTGLDEQQHTAPARPADRARSSLSGNRKAVRRRAGSGGEAREPIAIIGLSGRYPGAQNLEEYWENLKSGKDCVGEVPGERWPLEGFYNPDVDEAASQGQSYSKAGGFLSGFAEFDPLFFNITPREAANIDPQERLFIASCWQALEDGGYTREGLQLRHQGRVGVFAGITKTGFALHGPDLWRQGQEAFPHTSFGSVANRVSYLLNLRGPSMPIDTMCSASLTAIHEACEHLYRDECELALAGGVNLYLHPQTYVELCAVRMLSKDGRCKSFGKDGDGFVPGEGVGVVLLKRLSQALEAEDQIHAVIRATSINHGGKTNGYTVPNPVAQKELVRSALAKAQVNARSISYIEAHGTGTELGDPIEISGLTQAFAQDTTDKQFCAIGSAKSNIGHLEAAAGIAGVCKVVLQLKHRQLVPSLHAEELNPHIDFANSPFVVQRQLEAWRRPVVEVDGVSRELPLLAGVSSFGAGGSNAHVVIEEYVGPLRCSIAVSRSRPALVVLSAKNADRLREQVEQLVAGIGHRGLGDEDIADLAYTLQVGREAMESRLAVMAGSMAELVSKLGDHLAGKSGIEELYRGEVRREKEALSVLAGEDIAPIVDGWVEKGRHGKLLELWVKGWSFDWQRLYGEAKPRRISLPTYPFARERYWIEETGKTTKNRALNGAGNNGVQPVIRLDGFDELAYENLLDRLMDNSLTMAGAVREAVKFLP